MTGHPFRRAPKLRDEPRREVVMSAPFFIEAPDLFAALFAPNPPSCSTCGGAIWSWRADDSCPPRWPIGRRRRLARAGLDRARPVVVACAHGHNRSQRVAAICARRASPPRSWRAATTPGPRRGCPLVNRVGGVVLGDAPTLGDAAQAEDRPGRLPVAGRPLPRSPGPVPVRRAGPGARRGRRRGRDRVRPAGRPLRARRRALHLRHAAPGLRPGRRSAS